MEGGIRRLASLTVDELAGVLDHFPWFGAARLELCRRMAALGGSDWGVRDYSDAAMYIRSRTIVSDILRQAKKNAASSNEVERVLKSCIAPDASAAELWTEAPSGAGRSTETASAGLEEESLQPGTEAGTAIAAKDPEKESSSYRRTVRAIGGDFFSQKEYDEVRRSEDNHFSAFVAERSEEASDRVWEDPELGFCTETLAGIYAEQGYFAEAKKIYSRLNLRYPEKSAYFASLIRKLETEIIN